MNKQAERLQRDFDIEPEQGVPLDPLAALGKGPEQGPDDPGIQAESPDEEDVEPEEEPEDDEQQGADDTDWRMHSNDFAKEIGISNDELFHNVVYSTPNGKKTASEIVDEYSSILERQGQWEQERQQLQDAAQGATRQAVTQQVSPEAQRLMDRADFLEEQYGQIKWEQIEASERADLKIEYDRQIQGLRRQAQQKQQEWTVDQDERRRQFQVEAHRETLRRIPEWNSSDVFETDTAGITKMLRTQYKMPDSQIAMLPGDPVSMKIVKDLWDLQKKSAETRRGVTRIRKFSKSMTPSAKRPAKGNRLADVGKRVRQGATRQERQQARLNAEFER